MVEKTLSTGTLGLRFMQNVRRAQQLPKVEPEQAHVHDDAEWHVSPDIRDAWGTDAYPSDRAVTYETSYLPFLFPCLYDTPAADGPSALSPSNALRPRGRRAFNKRGEEMTQEASHSVTDTAPPEQTEAQQSKKNRPHSISSTGTASLATRQSKKSNKDPSKDAKNLVFNITGVGTDLRQSSGTQTVAFLRPSGVDRPADLAKNTTSTEAAPQSSTGTRSNLKRSRIPAEANKAEKKTRLTLIE